MTIEYRCPICKATNNLTNDNTICRRCKIDLNSVYKLQKDKINNILREILRLNKYKKIV